MNIYPNLTLVILQLIPFLLTVFALNIIIFKPLMNYLEERENASGGASEQAKQFNNEADEGLAKIQTSLKEAHSIAADKRSKAREIFVTEYNDVVHETRKSADQDFRDASVKIATEQVAASQEMKGHNASLANEIASQALGRTIA
jgi:F-type H+-transporting ATPase subunit b